MTLATLVQPERVRDLRGRDVRELTFPSRSVVLLAGIPGAGKTTLLRRLYALTGREHGPVWTDDGTVVLDSEHARNRWATWARPIPYRYWRPLVHLTHYRRLWQVVTRGTEPVVLHECGTRGWLFHRLVRHAARHGREVHVVLLDVPPSVAWESQRLRGRRVHRGRFARHADRWRRMVADAAAGRPVLPGAVTVTLIDRHAAGRLRALDFGSSAAWVPATSATRPWRPTAVPCPGRPGAARPPSPRPQRAPGAVPARVA
jgi:predicted kinase